MFKNWRFRCFRRFRFLDLHPFQVKKADTAEAAETKHLRLDWFPPFPPFPLFRRTAPLGLKSGNGGKVGNQTFEIGLVPSVSDVSAVSDF